MASLDSFGAKAALQVGEESFEYFSLDALGELNLPYTHRVLLENLLRTEDGANVTAEQIILGQGCVVSGPLPWLSPCRFSRPTFLVEEGPSSARPGGPTVSRPPSPDMITYVMPIFK